MEKWYRIIDTDNFGGDYPNEKFLPGRFTEAAAKQEADRLNGSDLYQSRFFRVVPEGYKLIPGFEP